MVALGELAGPVFEIDGLRVVTRTAAPTPTHCYTLREDEGMLEVFSG